MIHAHKFTECYEDMVRLSKPSGYPKFEKEQKGMAISAFVISTGLRLGQRFYYPAADGILEHKEITDDIKELIRLPYDCICVLTEQNFSDGPGLCDRITVAFTKEFNSTNHIVQPSAARDVDFYAFSVMDVSSVYEGSRWIPAFFGCSCKLQPKGISGYEITGLMPAQFIDSEIDAAKEMRPDVADILNLSVMLNLANVSAKEELVSERLNRKRVKCNRLPLMSYHVLEVDGERWASHMSHADIKSGIRSHMRRGHIRRLSPERKIWVRSTLVHGSRPGFVSKEYQTKPSIELKA